MKIARALVVGENLSEVRELRKVDQLVRSLHAYEAEIRAVEEMYRAIWQLHAFIDPAYSDLRDIVKANLFAELGISGDKLDGSVFADEGTKGAYGLVNDLREEIVPLALPTVLRLVNRAAARGRNREAAAISLDQLRKFIRDANEKVAEQHGAFSPRSHGDVETKGLHDDIASTDAPSLKAAVRKKKSSAKDEAGKNLRLDGLDNEE